MAYCTGDMREHVTILKSTFEAGANGIPAQTFKEAGTPSASVASVSGKEFHAAAMAGTLDVITVTTRWINGMTTADRIRWNGTVYSILEVNYLGARRDFIQFKCRAARV